MDIEGLCFCHVPLASGHSGWPHTPQMGSRPHMIVALTDLLWWEGNMCSGMGELSSEGHGTV